MDQKNNYDQSFDNSIIDLLKQHKNSIRRGKSIKIKIINRISKVKTVRIRIN